MLSLGSGQHSHLLVFVLLLQVCFFCFWFLNDYRNNTLKTNIFFFVSVRFYGTNASVRYNFFGFVRIFNFSFLFVPV